VTAILIVSASLDSSAEKIIARTSTLWQVFVLTAASKPARVDQVTGAAVHPPLSVLMVRAIAIQTEIAWAAWFAEQTTADHSILWLKVVLTAVLRKVQHQQ